MGWPPQSETCRPARARRFLRNLPGGGAGRPRSLRCSPRNLVSTRGSGRWSSNVVVLALPLAFLVRLTSDRTLLGPLANSRRHNRGAVGAHGDRPRGRHLRHDPVPHLEARGRSVRANCPFRPTVAHRASSPDRAPFLWPTWRSAVCTVLLPLLRALRAAGDTRGRSTTAGPEAGNRLVSSRFAAGAVACGATAEGPDPWIAREFVIMGAAGRDFHGLQRCLSE